VFTIITVVLCQSLIYFVTLDMTYTFHFLCFSEEGLKSVEIEKCKKSIDGIRSQIYEAQKKFIYHSMLRYIDLFSLHCSYKYFISTKLVYSVAVMSYIYLI